MVGDIRGRGLYQAVEFVQDKKTKAELPKNLRFSEAVIKAAYDKGLHIHGKHSEVGSLYNVEHVMIMPRYVVTVSELHDIVGRLKAAILVAVQATGVSFCASKPLGDLER